MEIHRTDKNYWDNICEEKSKIHYINVISCKFLSVSAQRFCNGRSRELKKKLYKWMSKLFFTVEKNDFFSCSLKDKQFVAL